MSRANIFSILSRFSCLLGRCLHTIFTLSVSGSYRGPEIICHRQKEEQNDVIIAHSIRLESKNSEEERTLIFLTAVSSSWYSLARSAILAVAFTFQPRGKVGSPPEITYVLKVTSKGCRVCGGVQGVARAKRKILDERIEKNERKEQK